MRVSYHPAVQKDVNAILKYYESVSLNLADEFWADSCALLNSLRQIPPNRILAHEVFAE
jgi:hypothetical protein